MTVERRPGQIEARHVRDPEGKLPDYPGYRIAIAGTPIFLLSFTEDLKGLHWHAGLDFSRIHELALTELPSRLSDRPSTLPAGNSEVQWRTRVTFSSKQGDIIELDLNDFEQLETYKGILERPEDISAVRYDAIDQAVIPPFEYHLYADNPTDQEGSRNPEVVVHMPKAQAWQGGLVEWARETALQADLARDDVDIPEVTKVLNELSEKGPFGNHPLLVDELVT